MINWEYEYSRCTFGVLKGQFMKNELTDWDLEIIDKTPEECLNEKAIKIKHERINNRKNEIQEKTSCD